jgi:ClpP class serine protease
MFQLQSDLWLGDEASLRHILALEARASMNAAILQPQTAANSGEKLPRLYSRYGEIGVITIRGGLINTEDRFTEYFNISTYPAIREALAFAASDQRVSQVLLDIESPGGVVSGVNDVAGLVREVRAIEARHGVLRWAYRERGVLDRFGRGQDLRRRRPRSSAPSA